MTKKTCSTCFWLDSDNCCECSYLGATIDGIVHQKCKPKDTCQYWTSKMEEEITRLKSLLSSAITSLSRIEELSHEKEESPEDHS